MCTCQAPYAAVAALVSVVFGTLPNSAWGVGAGWCSLLSAAALVAVARLGGSRVPIYTPPTSSEGSEEAMTSFELGVTSDITSSV